MDNLPGSPLLWGAIVALMVIALVFRRLRRTRMPAPRPRPSDVAASGSIVENLDSSHIGGPIFPNPRDEQPTADGANRVAAQK